MRRSTFLATSVFVLIWSTGFVVAKFAFPDADPLYFLAVRLLIAALILFFITLMMRAPVVITRKQIASSILIGLLLHGLYLGGVWTAIEIGAPAGVSSVVTSFQPILVSILAVSLLSESLSKVQLAGLVLGFLGVALIVIPGPNMTGHLTIATFGLLVLALSGSTAATLLQKKIGGGVPLLIGTTYQFASTGLVLLVISTLLGKVRLEPTLTTALSMAWSVLILSIAAILLLLWLLNHGSAAKVSSLLYLIPPMSVLQAYLFFGEKLNAQGLAGLMLTVLGVYLVNQEKVSSNGAQSL